MWIFQAPANWIKSIKTPKWLKDLLFEVQMIIVNSAFQVAKEYLAQIEAKVIEVNGLNIKPAEKFQIVFKFTRDLGINASDTILNIILNSIVLKLKNRGAI